MFSCRVFAAPRRCFRPGIFNAFTIVSILILSASASLAATFVVPTGGDLQAAINTAAAGDTIVLEAGAIPQTTTAKAVTKATDDTDKIRILNPCHPWLSILLHRTRCREYSMSNA